MTYIVALENIQTINC